MSFKAEACRVSGRVMHAGTRPLMRAQLAASNSRPDDCQEILRLQARAADQRAIDVGLAEQRRRVVRLDAAAVLDDERLRRRLAAQLADALADERMRILGLLRRGVDAGADRPDRLVGDDDVLAAARP